jgi:AbiV family abortive infection protein
MKTRQFKQLAGKGFDQRLPLLIEGLEAIATNVGRIAAEHDVCAKAGAYKAAELLRVVGREEAGKFLILIDSCRAPESHPEAISRQFSRAGNHLAKLIYAQIADYSIASQNELVRCVNWLRPALHLDGPNDIDWIFPNTLIAERESALYVDLVDSEGVLSWASPLEFDHAMAIPRSVRLVQTVMKTGIVCLDGLSALQDAWRSFDATTDTHCADWARRSRVALEAFAEGRSVGSDWGEAAGWVIELWPMPMVEIDISQIDVTADELVERRDAQIQAMLAREFGWEPDGDWSA